MIDPVPSRLLVPARVALSFRLAPVRPEDGLVVVEMVGLAVITTGSSPQALCAALLLASPLNTATHW